MRIEVWDDTAHAVAVAACAAHRRERAGPRPVLRRPRGRGLHPGHRRARDRRTSTTPRSTCTRRCSAGRAGACRRPDPGKRVRHEDGDEVVEDVPTADARPDAPDPASPTEVKPGTCPGCGSAGPTRCAPGRWTWPATSVRTRWTRHRPRRPRRRRRVAAGPLPGGLAVRRRGVAAAVRAARGHQRGARRAAAGRGARPAIRRRWTSRAPRAGADPASTGCARRGRPVEAAAGRAGAGRAARWSPSAVAAASPTATSRSSPTPRRARRRRPDARDRHARPEPGRRAASPTRSPPSLATVTTLRPFLRWDPVPSPGRRPRERYTEGESLRVLVVRSGVTQDLDTLAITVTARRPTPPRSPRTIPARPRLRRAQRAAPRAAQDEPDAGRAARHVRRRHRRRPTPTDHQRMLGIALLENGSFLDLDIADLDNPPDRIAQPGVRLETQPGTAAGRARSPCRSPSPATRCRRASTSCTTRRARRSPTCPTRWRAGISLVFPEAGLDRTILFPFGTEGFTARYGGRRGRRSSRSGWSLDGADELGGKVDGPGAHDRACPRATSSGSASRPRSTRDDLPLFGPWRSLPPAVRDQPRRRRGRGRRLAVGPHAVRERAARARCPPPARGAAADQAGARPSARLDADDLPRRRRRPRPEHRAAHRRGDLDRPRSTT